MLTPVILFYKGRLGIGSPKGAEDGLMFRGVRAIAGEDSLEHYFREGKFVFNLSMWDVDPLEFALSDLPETVLLSQAFAVQWLEITLEGISFYISRSEKLGERDFEHQPLLCHKDVYAIWPGRNCTKEDQQIYMGAMEAGISFDDFAVLQKSMLLSCRQAITWYPITEVVQKLQEMIELGSTQADKKWYEILSENADESLHKSDDNSTSAETVSSETKPKSRKSRKRRVIKPDPDNTPFIAVE